MLNCQAEACIQIVRYFTAKIREEEYVQCSGWIDLRSTISEQFIIFQEIPTFSFAFKELRESKIVWPFYVDVP